MAGAEAGELVHAFARGHLARRLARHAALALLAAGGCALSFRLAPADERWERAASLGFGYVALAFLLLTLLVGPWSVLTGRRNPLNVYLRRDVGIWAATTGLVHVVFGFQVHVQGKVWRYFVTDEGGGHAPLLNAFGLGNYSGALATLLLAMLLALSNDLSLRRLKSHAWKSLQRLNYLCFGLIAVHALLYQAVEERASVLRAALVAGLAITVTAQALGYLRVRARRRAREPRA